ncbi:hypothetical protein ACFCX4_18835 [Kitasatospora sp. NPDC056327]|uniref:hypothetical protein n=1 Tax=Kitasatospora sp. NPDC056327 TaxID=3345785 RepID=UPI0035D94843
MTRQPAATLRSRYVEQAVSDLRKNHERQRELAEELRVLKQEEALLADILELAERYEGFADPTRLPEQLRDGPAGPRTAGPNASGRKATTGPKASTPKAPRTAATRGGPARPLLGDLLADLLGRHDRPRPAKDLREELMTEHPKRRPTPQVVRNTLEALVAKGRVRRHKQQHTVLYTLVRPEPARDRAEPAADADPS